VNRKIMKKQAMKTRSAVMRLITNQRRQVIAWLIPTASFCRLPMKDKYRVTQKTRGFTTGYSLMNSLNFFILFLFFLLLFFEQKNLISTFISKVFIIQGVKYIKSMLHF